VFWQTDCTHILRSTTPFTGICIATWSKFKPLLKPTQSQVGYAWIAEKVQKDFTDANSAQQQMNDKVTPVIIGPNNAFYMVDDHHNCASLDFSGYVDTIVTVNVTCDKRGINMQSFWQQLITNNLVYLGTHPSGIRTCIPLLSLPLSLSLSLSPYLHKLAWLSYCVDSMVCVCVCVLSVWASPRSLLVLLLQAIPTVCPWPSTRTSCRSRFPSPANP
jgi:hypothetical protein